MDKEFAEISLAFRLRKEDPAEYLCHPHFPPDQDPPLKTKEIDFLSSDLVFYIQYLKQKLKEAGHPDSQFVIKSNAYEQLIGLSKSGCFGETFTHDKLEEECFQQKRQNPDIFTERRKKRDWNHSWFYWQKRCEIYLLRTYCAPKQLHSFHDGILLLIECMHADADLWTRIEGRWLISTEFFCLLDGCECVCFCIDLKTQTFELRYKDYLGNWRLRAQATTSPLKKVFSICPGHMAPPTLRDDCIVSLLKSRPTKVFTSRIPEVQKQRVRQLHTTMMRFQHWENTLPDLG